MTVTRLHPPDAAWTDTGSEPDGADATEPVVCKFGGTSVADAGQIERVRAIVAADPRRRLVVVSAPGRRRPDEEKVTDHLLNLATDGDHLAGRPDPVTPGASRDAVVERFTGIVEDLGIDDARILADLRADLECDLDGDLRVAYLASRGEHYSARVIAEYFRSTGMNARARFPEEFGLRVGGDPLAARLTEVAQERMAALDDEATVTVVPGFYGVTEAGDIAVFSRGGSDLTGGELAAAVDAHAYENWTDVSGVLEADPGVIPEARVIPRLTFKEIRLLASKGFNVFHLDAVLNCRRRGVPIHIRNTNRPQDRGTRILNERVPEEGVVGIARLDDVAYIYLEKDDLSEEIGFTADLLRIFQEFGINTYHYPTDKDDIAVLVRQDDLKGSINDLRRVIEAELEPDVMDVVYNLSILTAVGLGLQHDSAPLVAAISALGEHNVPIQMFHQSPSQLCFHIGVGQSVADQASRILYDALVREAGTTTTPSRSA